MMSLITSLLKSFALYLENGERMEVSGITCRFSSRYLELTSSRKLTSMGKLEASYSLESI
jgi:hypothetical protein